MSTKEIINQLDSDLQKMKEKNNQLADKLTDTVLLTDYTPCGDIWTKALQAALDEHEIVIIPPSDKPYLLDGYVTVPSNRKIIAEGATIRLIDGVKTIMLRNKKTADGTHKRIPDTDRDTSITIDGGSWEESCTYRLGYGNSGRYDKERSFFGVSTCMLFNNISNLTLKNMRFSRCGGFAVQIGDASNIVCENILFDTCFADGLHINGNVENALIYDVRGQVGDDLVALNMYDWLNSSINFGPAKNILCRKLELFESSHYKAIRIQPGIYTFDDGSTVDCSINNVVFQNVRGIKTFKLYTQTPPYKKGESPEPTGVGSGDNVIFDDIEAVLYEPIDLLGGYIANDPVTGAFALFELGTNLKNVHLSNISLLLDRDKRPYSYLIAVGPKSARIEDNEFFDPYLSSAVENLHMESIKINGKKISDASPYVKEIVFNKLYDDMESSASGKIGNLTLK